MLSSEVILLGSFLKIFDESKDIFETCQDLILINFLIAFTNPSSGIES